jgi:hypothetical protein
MTVTRPTTVTPMPAEEAARTKILLACGVVAGPVFLVVSLLQVLTREGFDITRHALSFPSIGDWGWIQITNFIVTGLLFVTCAMGMRRTLQDGRARTWAPYSSLRSVSDSSPGAYSLPIPHSALGTRLATYPI